MCHFAMGLTRCYKTTVFFTFILIMKSLWHIQLNADTLQLSVIPTDDMTEMTTNCTVEERGNDLRKDEQQCGPIFIHFYTVSFGKSFTQ